MAKRFNPFTGTLDYISLPEVEVTEATKQLAVNNSYIINKGTKVELTLPESAALGDVIVIVGYGGGGWKLLQNDGQTIYDSPNSSTTGAAGALDSSDRYACVHLKSADNNGDDWVVFAGRGDVTFTIITSSFTFTDLTNFTFTDAADFQFTS